MEISHYVDKIHEYAKRARLQIGPEKRTYPWVVYHFLSNIKENVNNIEHNNKIFQKHYKSRFNPKKEFFLKRHYGANLSDLCVLAENLKKLMICSYSPNEEINNVVEKFNKNSLEKTLERNFGEKSNIPPKVLVKKTEFLGYYFDKKINY